MKVLIALGFCADNAAQAERLLDYIHHSSTGLHNAILLAAAADVHGELRERIKISASLAFKRVYEIELNPMADPQSAKFMQVNNAFRQASEYISNNFTWPFLWLEPDCVPVYGGALMDLAKQYEEQPKGYFGTQMKVLNEAKEERFFMARVGFYPNNAHAQIFTPDIQRGPFEIAAGDVIHPKMTATKAIQQTSILIEQDMSKVRPDALLVHGDKQGILLRKLESDIKHTTMEPDRFAGFDDVKCFNPPMPIAVAPDPIPAPQPVRVDHHAEPRRRGRPTLAEVAQRAELAALIERRSL